MNKLATLKSEVMDNYQIMGQNDIDSKIYIPRILGKNREIHLILIKLLCLN